jgi:spore coat protein CotF
MDKKKIISLEIPNTLKEALRMKAFQEELTVSALIRQILEEQLKDTIKECEQKETKARII